MGEVLVFRAEVRIDINYIVLCVLTLNAERPVAYWPGRSEQKDFSIVGGGGGWGWGGGGVPSW